MVWFDPGPSTKHLENDKYYTVYLLGHYLKIDKID